MADLGVDSGFWAQRTVVVTGHTGFKGAWLSLWLASMGARVIGISDQASEAPALFAAAQVAGDLHADLRVDVRERERVAAAIAGAEADVVLHLAAQPYVRRSYAEPVETYATNVMGTAHVLDAVRHSRSVRSVVVVTSDKCYDDRGRNRPYTEDDPMGGHDPYSSSKGAAELVTDAYRRSYFREPGAARVGSARAGNVIGGGDWGEDRLVPDIMRAALAGTPIPIRRPEAVRPWQHVLDPLAGYLMLAQALFHDVPGADGSFNLGPAPEGAQPVRAIVDRLTGLWPEPLRWEIDDQPSPHEAPFLTLDSTRARTELGWEPRWGLDEALDAIVEWFLAYREGGDMRATTLAQIARHQGTTSR
ncbi:MAG: CDP-glucose 4,6-dehydratase [Solirubrobacteraceae bacterium]|nr:CDP-glucose 4,6-dehydratase [Solirubrobacteraceae bacterium]